MNNRVERDQTWETDPDLVKECARRFTPRGFDLDPCASMVSAKAPYYFTEKEDGLTQSWIASDVRKNARRTSDARPIPDKLSVWINFPFGASEIWVARSLHWLDTYPEAFQVMVFCCPSRTDRPWYHRLRRRTYMPDIHGRVSYGDTKGSPNFSTTIAVAWPDFHY